MKPSPEQVREWAEKAGAKFDPHWGISYNVGTATFERFAELAAQWGYEQATNFKPDWVNYQQGKEDGKAEALEQVTAEEPVGFDKGMTIRQWYAGLALQGMLSNSTLLTTEISQIAKEAFAMADAMIAEGSKQ